MVLNGSNLCETKLEPIKVNNNNSIIFLILIVQYFF